MGKQSTDIFVSLLFHLVSLNCIGTNQLMVVVALCLSLLLLLQFLTAVAAEW